MVRRELYIIGPLCNEDKTFIRANQGHSISVDVELKKAIPPGFLYHGTGEKSKNRYKEGNRQAWRALEDAYSEGKLKAIGVSNFQIEDLESLMETAKIKPMVNQVLCHISNTPVEIIDFCKKSNIAIEAYSPIAHGVILNQPEIQKMAEKYGVSVPQLCIRYTLQLGAIALPKTANPEHMKTNAEVDF